jgi:RNA polymerase sigma factor (sigma-70 family)
MLTDELLWEGMIQGDPEHLLSLYNRYYHTLLFVGLNEIRDPQLVKDTIQQLFLYLWEKKESLSKARNVKAYLLTSFLRKLTSDWKKAGRISNLQVVENHYAEESVPTPEEKLIRKDEQQYISRQLSDHINELPGRQKDLIYLKYYEGLSYEEIVQHTGLTHRTVYNKIHEALKKLRLDILARLSMRTGSF